MTAFSKPFPRAGSKLPGRRGLQWVAVPVVSQTTTGCPDQFLWLSKCLGFAMFDAPQFNNSSGGDSVQLRQFELSPRGSSSAHGVAAGGLALATPTASCVS